MRPQIKPLPQDVLDIADKTRSNLFAWRGQFSPQLVQALLEAYAPAGGFVVDPFLGSGTVLHEGGRLGLRVFGGDINPAAVKMAQVYHLINVEPARRARLLRDVDQYLADVLKLPSAPLWTSQAPSNESDLLTEYLYLCLSLPEGQHRDILESLFVVLDVYRNSFDAQRLARRWDDLKSVILGLPFSAEEVRASICDARELPIANSDVDLVVTSPPYINVFNYHQQYRASAELLGWRLLTVARSEIGSNRKNRMNRFLTVVQYCLDMYQVLGELKRVCRPEAQLVFVVGRESNVRKTPFYNSEIIEAIATRSVGLECRLRQTRVFTNRFGQAIYEDILHLTNGRQRSQQGLEPPLVVAREALTSALNRAPKSARSGLRTALMGAGAVRASPVLRLAPARVGWGK